MASYPSFDPSSLFRVDGMVAVITGGGTGIRPYISATSLFYDLTVSPFLGIGLAMAAALASNGAKRVYILGRRYDVLLSAVKLYPDVFYPIQCDVTSHESLRAAIDAVTANSGYINLLIVNSGAGGPSFGWDPSKPLTEVWEKLFPMDDAAGQELMDGMNQTFNVNTTAAFFTMAAFLDLLEKGNKHAVGQIPPSEGEVVFGAPAQPDSDVPSIQSQIIVTGSIAAYSRSYLSSPAYAASKAAVVHLAKQASSGLARYGIRVNALAPGCE